MMNPLEEPKHRLEFRALGLLKALYIPQEDALHRGILRTADGLEIEASIFNRSLCRLLRKSPEILNQEQWWTVYPKNYPKMRVQIKHMRHGEEERIPTADYFSFRGVVREQEPSNAKVVLEIRRNIKLPEDPNEAKQSKYRPFTITLRGKLPRNGRNQFWEIDATRKADEFVIMQARFVAMLPPEKPKRPTPRPTSQVKPVSKRQDVPQAFNVIQFGQNPKEFTSRPLQNKAQYASSAVPPKPKEFSKGKDIRISNRFI